MVKTCFWRPSSYHWSLWQLHKVLWVNDDLGNDVSTVDYSSLSCEHGARESDCSGLGYEEQYQCERKSVVFVQTRRYLPSGELTFCHGKSQFFMGKSTISMAIFHCFLLVPQAGYIPPVAGEIHIFAGQISVASHVTRVMRLGRLVVTKCCVVPCPWPWRCSHRWSSWVI